MEKKKLNMLLIGLAVCIVVVATILGVKLFGQSEDSGADGTEKNSTVSGDSGYIEPVTEIEIPDDGMYNVEVKTEGDMYFAEIGVYIYTDNTLEELVWFDKTDENGIAEFTAEDATGYVVVLQDIPEGYQMQEYYYITGAKTEIILKTALKEGIDLSEISYALGDVIHDFSVTTPDGDVYTVSEMLKEKKVIVLNFWYVQCGPCKEEFPYMNEAYAEYKDKVALLAMNPVNLDDEEIAKYKKDMGINFPMMQCEAEWANALGIEAYPTTVVIDRYGVISLIHTGSLPDAEIFKQLFAFYTADDYKQTVAEDIYDIVTTQLSEGTMDNPFELGGILDFKITVRPNQVIYFNMYRVDAMNVKIEDPDAYALYKDETYYPTEGVVGLKVHCPDTYTPAFVGIGNSGTEKKTFHVTLSADLGTYENPYTMSIGEFNVKVQADNEKGVFYEYRATKNGALTLQCLSASSGVKYDYYLQNMRTSENRNLAYDGVEDANGDKTVSINVEKGDRVLICISTLPDASGSYPAGSFKMKSSLGNSIAKDKQYYGVTVVDDSLNPIASASVKLICQEITEIEGVDDSEDEDAMKVGDEVSLVTDAKGVASRKIRIGTYKAVVTVPTGYTADTTEYVLTKDDVNITFMLNKKVTEMATYTVTVVDSDGKPVEGAGVRIGTNSYTTSSDGKVSASLPKGTYSVAVGKTGYVGVTSQFETGKTELTITLQKSSEDSPSEVVTYNITIKYTGTVSEDFSENIKLHFMSEGIPAGDPVTVNLSSENNGQAAVSVQLEAKDYTVELEFESETIRSYTADMTLTADKKELAIEVDEAIGNGSGESTTLYVSDMPVYYVYEGVNPIVGMKESELNYFVFCPQESGVYRIAAENTNATMTYWGANTNFIYEQTENLGTDYSNNSFTRSVSESGGNLNFIVALQGDTSATIRIERVDDVEAAIQPEVYKGNPPSSIYKYSGSELKKYFDPTADGYELTQGTDGYYRYNGQIVYVDLNYTALSMTDLVEKTGFKCYFDDDGDDKYDRIEDYTDCMTKYVTYKDEKYGYYPLNDDLMYMIKNGGEHAGWWDEENGNYRFEGKDVNTEIAWLFFCCSAGLN